jgi:hypothetical protein
MYGKKTVMIADRCFKCCKKRVKRGRERGERGKRERWREGERMLNV